jgi:2-polyprenyl-6-methoxyphenol hydroxylase-like FAD-dependent oxidoreductase
MADSHVPVVIVGGSLVGLTASILLASQGVPHVLIERHRGTAIHPRAASFHQRTMETFRSVELQEAVEAAAAKEFQQNGAIVSVESLANPEMTFFYRHFNEGVEQLSPTARLFITQIGLEPLLRDRAADLGADHRYGTELVGLEQDDDGVTVVIRGRDGGPEQTLRADHVIAADGAHSGVRDRLRVGMAGRGSFAECATIYFRADMRELIGDRNLSVVYVNQPELLGFFRFSITHDSGFLAVFSTQNPDGSRDTHVAEDLDTARCVALVRQALGRPDVDVEIDNVQRWTGAAAHAATFRSGRVFLAGDAAHVMPPTGGFGGNTGVADAHNLAWKLALVSRGVAGAELLETYDSERRPIAEMVVEQAYTRYVLRVDPSLPRDGLAAPLPDPSIELGPVHRSPAVLADADDDGAVVADPAATSGRPGVRAPHLPVVLGGTAASLLDLFGRDFTLLAAPDGQAWVDAVTALPADLPLQAHRVAPDGSAVDAEGRFREAYGTGAEGAVIVRPDGVVGWRTDRAYGDPRSALTDAMRRLLCR